jgi:hypothetical protein
MQCAMLAAALGATMLCGGAGAAFAQAEPERSGSQPFSERASNTGADARAPQVAPSLPVPPVGENASAEDLLNAARSALVRGRTGEAQEAMERAQTRLLDRSVPLFKTDRPSTHPAIPLISQAIKALGVGDRASAMRYLDQALPLAKAAGGPR